MGQPVSYSTEQIYSSIPQVLQNQDAANGYPLYNYLYGVMQVVDQINTLMFDSMGAGITVAPTYLAAQPITQAKLASNINASQTSITIFGTDATWNQINTANSFVVKIESEEILVPSGTYNWLANSVTLTGLTRAYDYTVATNHMASQGANGTLDLANYFNAPGWSQILDINRCPAYALPWLGQFIGAGIPQPNTLTYQQTLNKIQSRSSFQRATTGSLVQEITAVINSQILATQTPLNANQVIALENTALLGYDGGNLGAAITSTTATSLTITNTDSSWGNLGANGSFVILIDGEQILIPKGTYNWTASPLTITGVTRGYNNTTKATHILNEPVSVIAGSYIYGFNEYALTLLLPSAYYTSYTYASLVTAAAGAGTYAAVVAFVDTLGGFYDDLAASSLPSSSSPFVNFVYRYRPAGLRIFVGGY